MNEDFTYNNIIFIMCVNMLRSWWMEAMCGTDSLKRPISLPEGGCASTTSTDSDNFSRPKSLLPVDSLLCFRTSKAKLFCIVS